MKQIRCQNCGKWSSKTDYCEHCNEPLSEDKKEEVTREKSGKIKKPEPPGKLAAFFEYTRTSKNPLLRLLYYIVMSIWGIYVGLVVIIMYIVVAASG
ncbi:MAG: hypothetical protein WED10_14215 [Brumimicrobium sp.]